MDVSSQVVMEEIKDLQENIDKSGGNE
jgi:hypothetical protein